MWRIFRESVWDFLLGKVVTVLGLLGTAQTVVSLFKPDYVITVAGTFKIDYRVWFTFTLVIFIGIILRVLYVANRYKKRLEGIDNIRIVYNEKRYQACREVSGETEIIRVGYRVIRQVIDGPIILPSYFRKVEGLTKHTNIPIMPTPLTAMIPTQRVQQGVTPAYWVNVLMHKLNSSEMQLCYDNYPAKLIPLSTGRYELTLVARGTPSSNDVATLIITVDDNYSLTIEIEGIDSWNTA